MTPPGVQFKQRSFRNYISCWNWLRFEDTPRHHLEIADWLDRMWGRKRRLLLMAFRGAGKSTVVGLFCAWLLTIRPDHPL